MVKTGGPSRLHVVFERQVGFKQPQGLQNGAGRIGGGSLRAQPGVFGGQDELLVDDGGGYFLPLRKDALLILSAIPCRMSVVSTEMDAPLAV
jgi:hypothetical protein